MTAPVHRGRIWLCAHCQSARHAGPDGTLYCPTCDCVSDTNGLPAALAKRPGNAAKLSPGDST